MKTRFICAIGSLVLGALVGGCSAETASDEANTGSASLALVTMPQLKDSASCTLFDSSISKDLMLVFGGLDQTGTAVASAYLYEPGTGWAAQLPNMEVARTKAKAIKVPGQDQCLVVGGEEADGDAVSATEKFDLSDWRANNANGWLDLKMGAGTADTSLHARTDFSLVRCGTSKLIAVNGRDDSAANNAVPQIEVWTGTTWNDLVTASDRFLGAVASLDSNYTKFAIGGGRDGSSTYLNTLDLLTVDSDCANPTLTANPAKTNPMTDSNVLQSARKRLVAFPADNGSTNKFIFAGGELSGPTITGDVDRLTVTWNSPPTVKVETLTDLTTARADILLAPYGSNYVLAGGEGSSGPTTRVQFWSTSTPGLVAEDNDDFLTDARYRAPIEYLSSASQAFTFGGIGASSVILSSTEDVTDNP